MLLPYCPKFILRKIIAVPIPTFKQKDEPQWVFTKNGTFSLKSAYKWLLTKDFPSNLPSLPWEQIWELKVSARIKFFMWQLAHNCLPTAEFLHKRKIIENSNCTLCGFDTESSIHLFLECPSFSLIRHRLPQLENRNTPNFVLILH